MGHVFFEDRHTRLDVPQKQVYKIWKRMRELLSAYHMMTQQPNESVADFAHRFSEIQHELDKLIPGIHKTPGKEIELIFAFVNKLRSKISNELVSREFKFDKLQEIIEAAQCYEHHVSPYLSQGTFQNQFQKFKQRPSSLTRIINHQVGIRIINNVTIVLINRM